jgi:uncharacterized protein YidB (DUF937 family)
MREAAMSGILGSILGGLLGGGQSGQPSPIAGILEQILAVKTDAQGGAIGALVSRFQAAGLGEQAQSWVRAGDNLPVSTEQISKVFSPEQIGAWAQQAGTTPEALQGVLAQALPHVVDQATPNGQLPTAAPDLSAILNKLLTGLSPPRQA